jgi:hypothetical protein
MSVWRFDPAAAMMSPYLVIRVVDEVIFLIIAFSTLCWFSTRMES